MTRRARAKWQKLKDLVPRLQQFALDIGRDVKSASLNTGLETMEQNGRMLRRRSRAVVLSRKIR